MRTYHGDRFDIHSYDEATPDPVEKYFPEPELVKAVNLAILMEKPLLVMGDPGCGKSRLAEAIAREWYPGGYKEHYDKWIIKSGSKVEQGLYEIDHLRRLRDATFEKNKEKVDNISNYINYGPLYRVFKASTPAEPSVLLIDEIDKADIDFPNDLLMELDEYKFTIRETGEEVEPLKKPVIIITSNKEKDLPDAFLRRCVYHYIKPLGAEKLREIVMDRFYRQGAEGQDRLIEKAILKFIELRDKINSDILSIGKNISTSEFIDWFRALQYYSKNRPGEDAETADLVKDLEKSFTDQGFSEIPFGNLLFKTEKSLLHFSPNAVRS